MDRINQFDWGVYSHFAFLEQQDAPFFRAGFLISGYIGVGFLLLIAVLSFLVQRKVRSLLVCLISSAFAVGLIQTVHWLVPRLRPERAVDIVGPEDMAGSYPSAAVFLFMLGMIWIGFAVWTCTERSLLRGSYAIMATALTVWVCMSQFFLNLHFLTDVLGGIAGATVVAWLAYQLLDRDERKMKEADRLPAATNAIQDMSRAHGIQKN